MDGRKEGGRKEGREGGREDPAAPPPPPPAGLPLRLARSGAEEGTPRQAGRGRHPRCAPGGFPPRPPAAPLSRRPPPTPPRGHRPAWAGDAPPHPRAQPKWRCCGTAPGGCAGRGGSLPPRRKRALGRAGAGAGAVYFSVSTLKTCVCRDARARRDGRRFSAALRRGGTRREEAGLGSVCRRQPAAHSNAPPLRSPCHYIRTQTSSDLFSLGKEPGGATSA